MAWTDAVDIYCERTGPEFWAEPLNALSNLAFIAAGLIAMREARATGRADAVNLTLCLLAVAIGVGSSLFHTVAQQWAGLADVVPIACFILYYLYAAIRRFLGLQGAMAVFATVAIVAASILAHTGVLRLTGGSLNGSESYLPPLGLLVIAAIALAMRRHAAAPWIAVAAAVFALSLTARTLDAPLCSAIASGTHFIWHMLNGTMIGILLLAMIRFGEARRS